MHVDMQLIHSIEAPQLVLMALGMKSLQFVAHSQWVGATALAEVSLDAGAMALAEVSEVLYPAFRTVSLGARATAVAEVMSEALHPAYRMVSLGADYSPCRFFAVCEVPALANFLNTGLESLYQASYMAHLYSSQLV